MKKIILLLLCAISALISTAQTVNNAPVVKMHTIVFRPGEVIKLIALSDFVEDDITECSELNYTISIPRNGANDEQRITAKLKNKKTQLQIVKMLSFEQDTIFVTVSDGVNTTQDTIIVYVRDFDPVRNINLYFFDFYENGLNDWNAATAKTIPQNSLFAVRCCGGLVEVYSTTVPIYAGDKIITGNETQESFPMAPMNRIDLVIAKYHKIREVIVTNNQ